jgi:hypothetical protein
MPLEADPELARHADSALKIALGYWKASKIGAVATGTSDADVKAVTKRINPSLVGLADRQAYFRKALKAFAPLKAVAAAPVPDPPGRRGLAASPAPSPVSAGAEQAAGAQVPITLSGPQWCPRYPTSHDIADLDEKFASAVQAFVDALKTAGANVRISATYRPKERAYLMHWAWLISKGLDPRTVPPMKGVAINWVHPTEMQTRAAARAMVEGYGMVQVAALNSRHTERHAIDMTISWNGDLKIRDSAGKQVTIATQPRNGGNAQLVAVGESYGVIKLRTDPPHWSDDGR